MNDPKLKYAGPLPLLSGPKADDRLKRLPWAFGLVVVLPTLVAAIYFLLIASPRYVSEARFIVRASEQRQPSSLGMALEGVGISTGSSDAYAVHEYIRSADGLNDLEKRVDVRSAYARPGVDVFSRLPRIFSDRSDETFRKQFNDYLTVGYDSQTGISTLRVEAFTAADAARVANALLEGGEGLVNRLNERSASDAVADAERNVRDAQARLSLVQSQMTSFRNREGVIDPSASAKAGGELIGQLTVNLAVLRAERAQVAAQAASSPQLPALDSRIRAFEAQIAAEREKIVGDATSLAPKISTYESLITEREFAEKILATSTASLNSAQIEARRQRLYIDRVVNPSVPDKPVEPRRWLALLGVFATALLIYALGWLVYAGVRESRVHE
ncbi:MAG: chain-length determining protein [Brevundimonas sp.]|uniref:chain-length determining protein n=1 Tax=Brevundimonas sp. TaxID=1871086 RepID=UPI0040345FB3